MLLHSGYNTDFIAVEEVGAADPYASNRQEIEPAHVITEIKYGHAEGRAGSAKKVKLTPEMSAYLNQIANEMANKRIMEVLP